MRVSLKSDYGVRALLDLAERAGQGPVRSETIAARQEIPESYLDQLLSVMRKAGLVSSTRGPRGGHQLQRPPRDIRLVEVLLALEGELLAPAPPNTEMADSLPSVRVQREMWERVRQAMEHILDETTIEDLLSRQRVLSAQSRYYI